MTEKAKGERQVRFVHSLKFGLLTSLIIGISCAVLAFLAIRMCGNLFIDKYYLSEEKKQQRIDEYVSQLQRYIDEEGLTEKDTGKLAKWAKENKYLYVLIYKDDQLLFESGDYDTEQEEGNGENSNQTGDNSQTEGTGGTDEGERENQENDGNKYPGTGGLTIKVPSREDLIKYAEERGFAPIVMGESHLFVSMADFSEYFYYDFANIMAIVIGMLILILIIMVYFHRVTHRITRLGRDVTLVADGDIEHSIYKGGYDEIGKLSADVEYMRSSLVNSIANERDARDKNIELITSMSHDIRTPLTVLLGYLNIMKKYSGDDTMLEYIKASENTAIKLKNLSDDMFNYFTVFGADESSLDFKEYDAVMLFDQLLSEHILLLKEGGYTVSFDYGSLLLSDFEGKKVITDPNKLIRIIENIFSNIYKYADKSSPVSIFVSKNGEKIKLKFTNTAAKYISKVESNRIGLKTCYKLAEAIHLDFTAKKEAECFCVTMEFQLN